MRTVAALLSTFAIAACAVDPTRLPVPGAYVPNDKYSITIEFASVLNLPARAKVDSGGVQVGVLDRVQLVGSTAVVGLCAKPVIDVMVGVLSLGESLPAKDALRDAGYQYSEYKADVMHWFCKPSFAFRTHHLHLIPFESPLWNARLRFRDALRADPALRAEYAALKLELAKRFELDREAYTDAKSPFIERVLSTAG